MTLNKVPYFDPFSFPSLTKSMIGSDQILNRMKDVMDNLPKIHTYPPYNIRKVEDNKYVIEVAVAGFGRQDLEIEMLDGSLTIKGNIDSDKDNAESYIFKGIADRSFARTFTLADSVEIKNAELLNGMLKVWLERFIPEEKKSKKIKIDDPSEAVSKKQMLTEEEGK